VAASPETTGAANDVPDIHMLLHETARSGNWAFIVDELGTAPRIQRPGAATSGLKKPSLV
jgi:hypothetical protein